MRLALLTYDTQHRKTQEVFFRLRRRGFADIGLVLTPFKPRAPRAIAVNHRPFQFTGPSAQALAERYGLRRVMLDDWRSFRDDYDYYLICGANLIDGEFCNSAKVVNCHPGLVPQTRGLDSFKWAIHKNQLAGNTLHLLDDRVDLGTVFHQEPTPVFAEDDFATLAARHYDNEIDLLANFDRYLGGAGTVLGLAQGEATKRMPPDLEPQMMTNFETFKTTYAKGVAP
ncbi:MAG: formyltransferase family protein [Rhizomicrobium sp.]